MDELTDDVIERLHSGPEAFRRVVRDVAEARPEARALAVVAALEAASGSLAGALQRTGRPTDEARTAGRLALLLRQDVEAVGGDPTMAEVARYWRERDDFFLRL